MNLPDRIFAIGGAGKAMAYKLLESDWVVDQVLAPRPNPQSVTVTIVDTAQGEENTDRQRVQEYRQRITERQNELRDAAKGRTGDIEVQYKLITNDIQLDGQIDLLGDDVVPRIAAGNGMDEEDWWLDQSHINENLDFAKGVVRKRGLGKAIFYKAYAEDDQISSYIDLLQKGKVAVLVGLGGGTGSGILLDLVRNLKDKHRTAEITLFGILPNHTEGVEENTNAFAALSELEYLSLTDEQLFKDRVLIPIDPTGFDGKTGNRINTGQFLEELDEAAIYLLTAYYNTQGLEDPFADSPKYAPFTIGIPQVLRYNVEAINEARERTQGILGTKEDALAAEEEVYGEVDRFLSKHYGMDGPKGNLREMDKTDLRERLDAVRSLTEFDLFAELQYESLSIFNDLLRQAEEESDDITSQIEIVAGSLRAGAVTSGEESQPFVDNIDELLADILERNLKLLGHRKELLESMQAIDENQVRDTVEFLLSVGDQNVNPGVRLNRLETKLENCKSRRTRLENDLADAEEELEALREEQAEEIQRELTDWERSVRSAHEQYLRLDDLPIQSQVATLEGELESYCTEVVNAENEDQVDKVSEAGVTEALDNLGRSLSEVGIEFEQERQRIKGSLPALKRAKQAFHQLNADEGVVEKFAPWESSTEKNRKEANKDYRMQKNELDNKEVFSISAPGTSFAAEVSYSGEDIRHRADQQAERLENDVLQTVRSTVSSPESHTLDRIRSDLQQGRSIEELKSTVRGFLEDEAAGTGDIRDHKVELETELDDVEAKVETFEQTKSLFQTLNNRRKQYVDKHEEFIQQCNEYGEHDQRSVTTEAEDYVYVKTIQPNDVLRTTGDAGLAESDLFSNRDETQRLESALEELARNARNQQYTGLKRRKFSSDRTRYDDLKIRLAVQSPAINQIPAEAINFEDVFKGAYDLGGSGKRVQSPFTSWRNEAGDSWDIGISVFINGVFLDNIRKAVGAEGYFDGYNSQKETLGDDILIHHSLGLEEGQYVRRNQTLNMEASDDVEFYLRDEPEVVDDLLNDFVDQVSLNDDEAATTEADD